MTDGSNFRAFVDYGYEAPGCLGLYEVALVIVARASTHCRCRQSGGMYIYIDIRNSSLTADRPNIAIPSLLCVCKDS